MERTSPTGTVVVIDHDETLRHDGDMMAPIIALSRLRDYRALGGEVALVSSLGQSRMRFMLNSTKVQLGIAECGYLLIDNSFAGVETLIPDSFFDTYSSGESVNPLDMMNSLGLTEYLTSMRQDGCDLVQPYKNADRIATYCFRTADARVDLDELQENLDARFGPGFVVFATSSRDTSLSLSTQQSDVRTCLVAPRDPLHPHIYGKAYGLQKLAETLSISQSAIHFAGVSMHDLYAGIAAGVSIFGLANCERPGLWKDAGVHLTRFSDAYGVADYVENTFSLQTHPALGVSP